MKAPDLFVKALENERCRIRIAWRGKPGFPRIAKKIKKDRVDHGQRGFPLGSSRSDSRLILLMIRGIASIKDKQREYEYTF